MKRLALSYDDLLADIYWMRAVQFYGSTKLSGDPYRSYGLLYPLLDVTTSLDGFFNVAYHFGSLFLAEPPPGGPGRPDQAIALLEKGLVVQPTKWEFAQAIGFVHYWWYEDYPEAASWFDRSAKMSGAPIWMAALAAVTHAEGGGRETSRQLWRQIQATGEEAWYRREAVRRLSQLDAMDQIDELAGLVAAFERRRGERPDDWNRLVAAGDLRGVPLDPMGQAYRLVDGVVSLDPSSRLLPLPKTGGQRR